VPYDAIASYRLLVRSLHDEGLLVAAQKTELVCSDMDLFHSIRLAIPSANSTHAIRKLGADITYSRTHPVAPETARSPSPGRCSEIAPTYTACPRPALRSLVEPANVHFCSEGSFIDR
jgi:hypothetical protein